MSRRFARGAALVLAGAFVLVGADGVSRHLAETRVAALLSANRLVQVANIRAAPFGGEVVVRGISAQIDGARLGIGQLRLPTSGLAVWLSPAAAAAEPAPPSGPAPAPPLAPTAGTIRADDVVLTQGSTTVRIKRIDIAGTKLTNADLSALLDPKSPDSFESRLRKLTATAIVIPELTIDDPTPGSERHALLRQILIANVSGGKAAAVSASETSIAMSDGQAVVNGASGAIEASGVDLVQVAHLTRGPRKDDAEPIRPLFAKAVINAPHCTNAAQDAGLAATSIVATNVSGRPLAGTVPIADAATLSPIATARLSDFVTSFSIGTLDIDGFVSHGEPGGEETKIAAAHARLDALGDGKIGGVSLRGFDLDGSYAKLAIGTADVGRVEIPAPAGEGRVAARPGQLDLGKISVEVIPRDRPGSSTPMRFTIDHVALAQGGGPSTIPASGSATFSNLAFDLAPDGALTRTLYDMGYHHMTLAAALTSSYDAGAQELTVQRLSVNDPAMGSVEVALRLANVSQGLLSADPETVQASAIAVLAKSIDLRIANTGLFEKAIAFKAQQDGVSIADERTSGVDFFANKLPLLLGDGVGAKAIGGAVARFIADPKTLHISLASNDGLGVGAIGMLGDPGALLDSLDVHASAND